MDILQINNLNFRYPETEKKAVDNVSVSVAEGEFVVLCGESGCGKSTFLRLLKRELTPYGGKSGKVIYKGTPLENLDKHTSASKIGFVLQNPESQIVTDKVWHELAFGLESLGYDNQVIRRKVAEMASYFGIEKWFNKDTMELSGGQKQILNLASVMVMRPEVLLLDEPTAQLDPIAASDFIATLKKLNSELGLTIILVEHRLEEVFSIADRIFLMEGGKLVFYDKPRKIIDYFNNNPNKKMVAGLPAAMRIFERLSLKNVKIGSIECPITVREGRDFITTNFNNKIKSVKEIEIKENYKQYSNDSRQVILELKNVVFRYEKEAEDVLKNVSFKVYEGENFCLLGGNGTGKTTTLSVMAGLLKAKSGKVILNGKKIDKYDEKTLYRHNIAVLPQNPQTIFLENTVKKDFLEICRAMEYKKDEIDSKIQNIAEKMEILHLLNTHPYDLSGGEQQKAALAKILLLEPKILLLDEPTKGIDAYYKQKLSELLRKLKGEGITIVIVTHDVEFAAVNADRCGMFFNGEMVSVDKPEDFFADNNFYTTSANRIVRDYYEKVVSCEDVVRLCIANATYS